jgi:hypothetical protein
VVRHIVLIKTGAQEQVDAILKEHLPAMVGAVPGLQSVEIGYQDISGLGLTRGYDRVVLFTFSKPSDLQVWDDHRDHVAVRSALSGLTEMLVFDYEA